MKPEFSQHIFEKYSNIKLHQNSSSKAKLFQADGQTDRHDESNSHFSKVCKGA